SLSAIADVAVSATGANGGRRVGRAALWIAAVRRAGVLVVQVGGGARLAAPRSITQLVAIARVAVLACGACRDGDVDHSGLGIATVGGAGVAIVYDQG